MKTICKTCGGNGYVAVDVQDDGKGAVYDDCPTCHCEGEVEDGLMEAHQTQRELGE